MSLQRKDFLKQLFWLGLTPGILKAMNKTNIRQNSIRLIRHATLLIEFNGKTILVDPMFSPKDAMDPIGNSGNTFRFPMVPLPLSEKELADLVTSVDAILVTHLHRDHWDVVAQQTIPKDKRIFCQPNDAEKIRAQGFTHLQPVSHSLEWEGLTIIRTGGRHGLGEMGQKMGEVSGFVIRQEKDSIYIAGDTVWCPEVATALTENKPAITVLNAGGARFLTGGLITMEPEDILQVHHHLPDTQIIAVHMDTVNHCLVKRTDLAKALTEKGIGSGIHIPLDGERILC